MLVPLLALAQDEVPTRRPRPFVRGACLSLHDEEADRDYADEIAEIASRLGASHVSIAFHLWQKDASAPVPARGEKTPSDDALRRAIRQARARNLAPALVPIVLLEEPRKDEWRGKLAPKDEAAWLEAYRALVLHYAKLAAEEQVAIFSVGSELGWSEKNPLWRSVIKDVRAVFPGELTYSANWDHYANVPFWDALDLVGLSGYYELAKESGASVAALRRSWEQQRDAILAWRAQNAKAKPLIFTEVGYPSVKTAAQKPWDYTGAAPVDTDEQRRCYEAFVLAWARTNELAGVFFYEWWGEGGLEDGGYTPRDKPAEGVVRRFFSDLRVVEKKP
jgi:hypothetical protein